MFYPFTTHLWRDSAAFFGFIHLALFSTYAVPCFGVLARAGAKEKTSRGSSTSRAAMALVGTSTPSVPRARFFPEDEDPSSDSETDPEWTHGITPTTKPKAKQIDAAILGRCERYLSSLRAVPLSRTPSRSGGYDTASTVTKTTNFLDGALPGGLYLHCNLTRGEITDKGSHSYDITIRKRLGAKQVPSKDPVVARAHSMTEEREDVAMAFRDPILKADAPPRKRMRLNEKMSESSQLEKNLENELEELGPVRVISLKTVKTEDEYQRMGLATYLMLISTVLGYVHAGVRVAHVDDSTGMPKGSPECVYARFGFRMINNDEVMLANIERDIFGRGRSGLGLSSTATSTTTVPQKMLPAWEDFVTKYGGGAVRWGLDQRERAILSGSGCASGSTMGTSCTGEVSTERGSKRSLGEDRPSVGQRKADATRWYGGKFYMDLDPMEY